MSSNQLALQVGDFMQLEQIPEGTRHTVRIIGYVQDRSLIVSIPTRNGNLAIIREGQGFAARTMVGSEAVGFRTKMLMQRITPYPYMHLAFPKDMESKQVRNAHRVSIGQSITVAMSGDDGSVKSYPAMVSDLSITGARLSGSEPFAREGIKLGASFSVEVAETKHTIRLSALVRNYRHNEQSPDTMHLHEYGVQFQDMDAQTRLVLSAFINERLVEDMFD